MGRVIYKYELPKEPGVHSVMMPRNPEVLGVDTQNGRIVLWAIVGKAEPDVPVWFQVAWTGHHAGELDEPAQRLSERLRETCRVGYPCRDTYRGSVQIVSLVYHVFQLTAGRQIP